ncbi:MAG: glycine-rich protein [Gaiellales bacterium]
MLRAARFTTVVGAVIASAIALGGTTTASAAPANCFPRGGFNHCLRYVYSGTPETLVVPNSLGASDSLDVEVFGAGGGGTAQSYWVEGAGGGGGYTHATVTVGSATSFIVTVGQGGQLSDTVGTFGGGGPGGVNGAGAVNQRGSSGGGMSGFWSGTPAVGTALLIAGGGGGASPGSASSQAGGGGGSVGTNDAIPTETGRSANQSGGGAAATDTAGCPQAQTAGSRFQGGGGGGNSGVTSTEGGGGGGGGWFGGGGGRCQNSSFAQNGGGGGGSGYIAADPAISAATTSAAAIAGLSPDHTTSPAIGSASAGAASAQYIIGVGRGGDGKNGTATAGGGGMVVIQWNRSGLSNLDSTGAIDAPQHVDVPVLTGDVVRLLDGSTPVTTLTTADGTYTVDSAIGRITFTPRSGFAGTASPVTIARTDAYAVVEQATYTATVTARPADPPAALPTAEPTPVAEPPVVTTTLTTPVFPTGTTVTITGTTKSPVPIPGSFRLYRCANADCTKRTLVTTWQRSFRAGTHAFSVATHHLAPGAYRFVTAIGTSTSTVRLRIVKPHPRPVPVTG